MAAGTAGIQVGGGAPSGGGGGSVTAVTASGAVASSGGATPNITLAPIAQGNLLYNAGPGAASPVSTSLATVLGLAPSGSIPASALALIPLSKIDQSGATANQVPRWNGTNWVPATLAILPPAAGTGIVVQTSPTATVNRTLTAGTGITVTNGSGVSGNPTVTALAVQLTGHVSGSGNLGTNVNTTLATIFANATFPFPVSLTTDQYGRVIGCGSANAPQSVAVLAKLGDPFAPSGSWSPGEYLGTTTIFSTPDPTLAGGFLEADGESIIDLFSVMVQQAVPSTDYKIEVWELDEFNNPSQCISNVSGSPIEIIVPAGRNFAQNTVDTFTLLSGHRLLIRLEPGFGFSPGQVDCSARRVKA